MRLHRQDDGSAAWLLSPGERELLLTLFSRPLRSRLPPRLSRTSAALDQQGHPELAAELEGHRGKIRAHLIALLREAVEIHGTPTGSPSSDVPDDGSENPGGDAAVPQGSGPAGCLLRLTPEDREAFLQALNELRLGAWEQLGRPDPPEIPDTLTPTSPELLHWWTLEIASRFQSRILAESFPE